MNKKTIAQALGIYESATDEVFEAAIVQLSRDHDAMRVEVARLATVLGNTGDEAYGVLLAWKESHEKLPAALARVTQLEGELEGKANAAELDQAIAAAKADHKLTPAEEIALRAQVDAKEITVKGAKAMLAAKTPIPAFANGNRQPAIVDPAAGSKPGQEVEMKFNGKTYAEMNGVERQQLHVHDKELFTQMREQAHRLGKI